MIRLLTAITLLLFANILAAQDDIIKKLKYDGGEMEVFLNSPTLSQATFINNLGSVVGTREVFEKGGVSLRSLPFYSGKHGTKNIPIPDTYTNIELTGISDSELVIGYATRPLGHKDGSLFGFVWSAKSETFSFLPKVTDDIAHHPQDISADGKRITGYTTGQGRLRPVLWQVNEKGDGWDATVLPTELPNNPYLMSGQLMISPNGKIIAGCCTERIREDGVIDSSLYVWTEAIDGWLGKKLSDNQLYLRGINNNGEMAGSILGAKGDRQPCYVSPQGEFQILELLPNDVSGEAKDINNQSVLVGFSDDPPGADGGPEPCLWSKDGKVKRLLFSSSSFGAVHSINDRGQMAGMSEVALPPKNDSDSNQETLVLGFRTLN